MFERFEGKTLFDLLDFVTANLMMPLSGLLVALFVGWFMSQQASKDELALGNGLAYNTFMFVLRYLTPAAVLVVFVYNLV